MVPISGNHMHAFHTIWPLYPLVYIQPHQFKKKLQHHFPKIRRGGLKAVWSFSENSFDLVAPSFPNWKKKRTQACAGYTLFTLYIILVSRTLDNLILCFSRQPVISFFYFILLLEFSFPSVRPFVPIFCITHACIIDSCFIHIGILHPTPWNALSVTKFQPHDTHMQLAA